MEFLDWIDSSLDATHWSIRLDVGVLGNRHRCDFVRLQRDVHGGLVEQVHTKVYVNQRSVYALDVGVTMGIDIVTVAILSAWVVALVAAIRKLDKRIDGLWVLLVALGCALASAFAWYGAQWQDALRYALLAWIGAVGGVRFVDRAIDRVGK